jgi:hypothetical protein
VEGWSTEELFRASLAPASRVLHVAAWRSSEIEQGRGPAGGLEFIAYETDEVRMERNNPNFEQGEVPRVVARTIAFSSDAAAPIALRTTGPT